jgi:hypothetical protein
MSKKFRWFLLASCAFVVLMGGRDTIVLLAGGPQLQRPAPERKVAAQTAADSKRAAQPAPGNRRANVGELARGELNGN